MKGNCERTTDQKKEKQERQKGGEGYKGKSKPMHTDKDDEMDE